jgi:hypothetical protein
MEVFSVGDDVGGIIGMITGEGVVGSGEALSVSELAQKSLAGRKTKEPPHKMVVLLTL